MNTGRRAASWPAAALAALLAGCASVGEPGALAGRLSVQVSGEPARSVSAAFELRGDADRGSLALSSPLGTRLAQASWSPQQVMLETPQGQTRYADMPALTRELLGEELPLAALFDWLRGRAWAGAASLPTVPPEAAGFVQLGWQVTLAQFDAGLVVARRTAPPEVTLRAKLDRP